MVDKLKINEKIKKLREDLCLSQERFGKKIGVSGKTVSAYETGKCVPPLKILEKVSKTYGASFITIDSDKHSDLISKLQCLKNILQEIEEKFV